MMNLVANRLALFSVLMVVAAIGQAQERPTPFELNRELLGFYTNYTERVAETIDRIQVEVDDPGLRHTWQAMKLGLASAVFDVVTSDDPANQLIDLIAMLRLQTGVWADGGQTFATASQAERMRATFASLEDLLGEIALDVLPSAIIADIRSFADDYAREYPDRRYRAFTRLKDLPASDAGNLLRERARSGFLFRRLDDATRQIEASRFTAERAMFMARAMPMLMQWHGNQFLYRTLSTPEVEQVLGNLDQALAVAERMAATLDQLPEDLSAVLGENQDAFASIAADVRATSDNIRVISETLAPVVMRYMDLGRPPLDLAMVNSIAEEVAMSSQELARTAQMLRDMGYNTEVVEHATTQLATTVEEVAVMLDRRIAEVDARVERQVQHLFYLLVALLVIHLLGRLLFYFLERRRTRHEA